MKINISKKADEQRYQVLRSYIDLMRLHKITIQQAVAGIMKLYKEVDPEKVILPCIRRAKEYSYPTDIIATEIDSKYQKGK